MVTNANLSQCTDVANLEAQYLHDHQILLQELVKFLGGSKYFDEVVAPKMKVVRSYPNDWIAMQS